MRIAQLLFVAAAEEVRLNARSGEELPIDTRVVKARHRPAIKTEGAGSEDQVRALQTSIPHSQAFGHAFVCFQYPQHHGNSFRSDQLRQDLGKPKSLPMMTVKGALRILGLFGGMAREES